MGHDAFGDFALKHQHHRVVPRRPRLDRKPIDQKRGRNIVGQVGDDFCARGPEPRTRIEVLGVGADDFQPSRISLRDFLERGEGAFVALHRDHVARSHGQQGARQSPRTGTDLDHGGIFQRARGTRDTGGEIEIQKEILPERFAGRK